MPGDSPVRYDGALSEDALEIFGSHTIVTWAIAAWTGTFLVIRDGDAAPAVEARAVGAIRRALSRAR